MVRGEVGGAGEGWEEGGGRRRERKEEKGRERKRKRDWGGVGVGGICLKWWIGWGFV